MKKCQLKFGVQIMLHYGKMFHKIIPNIAKVI